MDDTPILDNHLHLDLDNGEGLEAVADFQRAGGTHLLVVNKPSWQVAGMPRQASDFRPTFETTIDIVDQASEIVPGRAWAILGVHPALISHLIEDRDHSAKSAAELMQGGIDLAAEFVAQGQALGLKSGRPHYPVSTEVWAASNEVIKHAITRAASLECALQLHTETSEDLTEISQWAEARGLPRTRVVKHFANGVLQGPIPSVISRREELTRAVETNRPFLMETDFIDDPDRPGAVLGPKTVPRRVSWMRAEGFEEAIRVAHVETPQLVYGIDTRATLRM